MRDWERGNYAGLLAALALLALGACEKEAEKPAPAPVAGPTISFGEVAEAATCELGERKAQFTADEPLGILYEHGGAFGMRSLKMRVVQLRGRSGSVLDEKQLFVDVTHDSLCVMGDHVTPAALGAGEPGTYEVRVFGRNRRLAAAKFDVVTAARPQSKPEASPEGENAPGGADFTLQPSRNPPAAATQDAPGEASGQEAPAGDVSERKPVWELFGKDGEKDGQAGPERAATEPAQAEMAAPGQDTPGQDVREPARAEVPAADREEAAAAAPAPGAIEPVQSEPADESAPESRKTELAEPEPVKPEPTESEPTEPESAEPVRAQVEPVTPEPAASAPAAAEPTEPAQAASNSQTPPASAAPEPAEPEAPTQASSRPVKMPARKPDPAQFQQFEPEAAEPASAEAGTAPETEAPEPAGAATSTGADMAASEPEAASEPSAQPQAAGETADEPAAAQEPAEAPATPAASVIEPPVESSSEPAADPSAQPASSDDSAEASSDPPPEAADPQTDAAP